MSESAIDKTTRKVVDAMQSHQFCFYATVHLNSYDIEENKKTIERSKRLIKQDNPDQLIFYFISRNADSDGEFRPYISFYSYERLSGKRLLAEEAKREADFAISGKTSSKRIYISRNIEAKYQGIVRRIKEGKVYDLSYLELPEKFKRFGFLNKANLSKSERINKSAAE